MERELNERLIQERNNNEIAYSKIIKDINQKYILNVINYKEKLEIYKKLQCEEIKKNGQDRVRVKICVN